MSILSGFASRDRYRQGFPVLPGELPFVGHLPRLAFDAVQELQRGIDKLGPVFWVKFGPRLEALFLLGNDSFEVLKNKAATMRGAFDGLDRLIGESTITLDGAPHARMRGSLNPTFSMRGIVASGSSTVMANAVSERIDRWLALRKISTLKETQELALDIIFRVSGVPTTELPEWHRQNRIMSLFILPFRIDFPGSPRRRAARAADWIDRGLLEIVERAKRDPDGKSLAHSLLAARDEQGQGLSDRELVDNLRVLLFAGHETTASVLAWLTLLLAQRPELWEKLVAEVQSVKDATIPTSIAEAKTFPFGEALFREAMRRYTPAWFTRRKLTEDLQYKGYRIPAGTKVALSLGNLLMDPAQYKDPQRFDPTRWLGRNASVTPLEMAAFGGGPHFCLGYHLAWLEVQQFLVALAQKMTAAGLRPRMPDGPGPRESFFPLRHPSGGTQVEFVSA